MCDQRLIDVNRSLWQTDTFIANCPYAPAKFECWGSGPHDGDEVVGGFQRAFECWW